MKAEFLHQNIIKLLSQRNGLLMLAGILSLSNVLLVVALICKSERIILVPPHIHKVLWIEGGEISKEYLEEMGAYLSKLLLDISPTSFPYNHETLLKYATPEAHGELKKQLIKDGEQYTQLQLSTHFKPAEVIASPQILEVQIKGLLTSFMAGKQVKESQETIILKFTQRGGGLLLESISGGNPHAS
ncbi:MAG: type IV conjugative transfer system protein TraE [Proteobacteria bacterium]|nr:type IV conjugative transfer system protein TraE [Pseudomonadota bacterium]